MVYLTGLAKILIHSGRFGSCCVANMYIFESFSCRWWEGSVGGVFVSNLGDGEIGSLRVYFFGNKSV